MTTIQTPYGPITAADVVLAMLEEREHPREPWDLTDGCGTPARPKAFGEVVTGRVCAGTGARLSCQLCPSSPTYWNRGDSVYI